MLTLKELKIQVNDFYQKLNDPVYVNSVLTNHPTTFTKKIWSKDMAYSLKPFGLELLGFKGSKYLTKKPVNVKYLYEHKLIDDTIREVMIHDKVGNHIQTDYLYRDGAAFFELSFDLVDNQATSLTNVVYKDDRIISSLRVDSDKHFWYSEYVYVEGRIKQILVRQYNSQDGKYVGTIEVDYIDNMVSNIYYYYLGKRYNYYIYT